MAIGDNAFETFAAKGNREDINDVIANITPMDTWFTTTIGTTPVRATYHEWQTDVLADAAANAVAEGSNFTDGACSATTRVGNYTQILTKVFAIAATQEAVDKAGRKSEIAYQTEKKMKELARDVEYALLLNTAAASASAGSARTLKGVDGWIATNVETGTGTADTMKESRMNDALQTLWAAGGKPSTLVCGAGAKRAISGFTTNTRYMVADENKIASAVDVYQSDFGTIMVRLHHQVSTTIPTKALIFGDMDLWKKGYLRPVKRVKQPWSGDGDLFSMVTEMTLESRQEKGSAKMTNLNYTA
jgi:hypothetical protein